LAIGLNEHRGVLVGNPHDERQVLALLLSLPQDYLGIRSVSQNLIARLRNGYPCPGRNSLQQSGEVSAAAIVILHARIEPNSQSVRLLLLSRQPALTR